MAKMTVEHWWDGGQFPNREIILRVLPTGSWEVELFQWGKSTRDQFDSEPFARDLCRSIREGSLGEWTRVDGHGTELARSRFVQAIANPPYLDPNLREDQALFMELRLRMQELRAGFGDDAGGGSEI